MKRMCREALSPSARQRPLTWREAFPHASIVTDPRKLAQLKAEVLRRKQRDGADERQGSSR
jgi:hypothetical protein